MSETRAENVPTTTVALDKPRTLAFTLGAMQRIKKVTGHSVLDLANTVKGGGTAEEKKAALAATMLDEIHVWIWAMMDKEDRAELSPEDVADLLHPKSLPAIAEAIGALTSDSMPDSTSSLPEGAEGNGQVTPPPAVAAS